jgi:hypothetical protein
MPECWAANLGSCDEKISKEHLVSRSLFVEPKVRVQGLSWCKDGPVEIGLDSLAAKILCKHHNSMLSPVDTGGASAFSVFREMRINANQREKLPNLRMKWSILRYAIDGLLLERWLLKTLINLCINNDKFPIGESNIVGKPSDELVNIAFGLAPFPGAAGLYFIVNDGYQIYSSDEVTLQTLVKDDAYIAGGLFAFRGLEFLLFLNPGGPPLRLTGVKFGQEDLSNARLNYHNRRIDEYLGPNLSQIIEIKWN